MEWKVKTEREKEIQIYNYRGGIRPPDNYNAGGGEESKCSFLICLLSWCWCLHLFHKDNDDVSPQREVYDAVMIKTSWMLLHCSKHEVEKPANKCTINITFLKAVDDEASTTFSVFVQPIGAIGSFVDTILLGLRWRSNILCSVLRPLDLDHERTDTLQDSSTLMHSYRQKIQFRWGFQLESVVSAQTQNCCLV